MSRLPFLMFCALAAATIAGCGTSADRDEARTAAQTLYTAVGRHHGDVACAQMSPSLRAALVEDEQERCARAVMRLHLTGATVDVVRVYADAAEVRFDHGDTVFLSDTSQGWRVEALGCTPQGKGPYDCEEEA
jgi:outer membrane murein-binding lipoprotein Lpp